MPPQGNNPQPSATPVRPTGRAAAPRRPSAAGHESANSPSQKQDPASVTIADACDIVTLHWQSLALAGAMSPQTEQLYTRHTVDFRSFAQAHGVTRLDDIPSLLVRAFEEAPGFDRRGHRLITVKDDTRRQRRAALARFLADARALHFTAHHPLMDSPPISRPPRRLGRSPEDDDIDALRFHAGYGAPRARYAALLALLTAGQSSAEIAKALTTDFDPEAASITTDGATYTRARTCALDPWSTRAVADRVLFLERTRGPGPHRLATDAAPGRNAQASIGAGFSVIARRAGLSTQQHPVRLRDITAWYGREVLAHTGSLPEVARALGRTSLDSVAAIIAYPWRDLPRTGTKP